MLFQIETEASQCAAVYISEVGSLARDRWLWPIALLVTLAFAAPLTAQEDERVVAARAEYARGLVFVEKAQWGEAITAFEKSASLHPHPLTTYNVAACERALGRYTRARRDFVAALAKPKTPEDGELPATYAEEARGYLAEIDGLLVRLDLTLSPADAAIAVDGRPLLSDGTEGDMPLLVAGLQPTGKGAKPPAGRVRLLMDPGARVVVISRAGYADVANNRSYAPGARSKLLVELDRLPAILRIRSDRDGAVVTVGGVDVGTAPVELSRPAGTFEVVVRKPGFVTYRTDVELRAGEATDLGATLSLESEPLTAKWWFWTAAGVVVVGAAVTTYALTRPPPEHNQPNGGDLKWVVTLP